MIECNVFIHFCFIKNVLLENGKMYNLIFFPLINVYNFKTFFFMGKIIKQTSLSERIFFKFEQIVFKI